MDTTGNILLKAGGKDQVLADFGALCEATTMEGLPKYNTRPTLENLAKFITSQSGGPNKDMALFELCHLVYGVGALKGADALVDFFLSPQKATPSQYKMFLKGGTHASVEYCEEHIRLNYGDKHFDIRFGRMPFLVSVFEFLTSMDDFSYFARFNTLFDNLVESPLSEKLIRDCTNALAADLRKYRIANLSTAQADGKFVQVYKFLSEQSGDHQIILEDDAVLDFWCLHNKGKDYRGYRTVFDLFSDFAKSFEETQRLEASHNATRLGVNMEEGEIDIANEDVECDALADWVMPFNTFDQESFSDVRFFKKSSERNPVEKLMAYGPDALRLPLAFLRYEIFGQVQSGITNDLQVGRPKASVEQRISCEGLLSYEERLLQCESILEHVKKLQASSLHVLSQKDDNVIAFPQNAKDEAKAAFSKMNRKGFDEEALENMDVFEQAAQALIVMERQLIAYMDRLKAKDAPKHFEDDKKSFSTQFEHLYQEVLT
ncbi:hypothetical protein MTBPR1_90115 [Candidatus Terasakiella magnetica]|uniref:Uncharacterized protein n=1 Tax=Candidatus Terasakiella magnetica TaxID=1867952 RepID=A0A1C3RM05_9PROT|nr:hypothetical protein [Candidatus Terasakiella magnetica]SCA58268.1 hypothetical protein MTBPR1_90115 [Candidatus Terasakiella magnetica]